jgi:hypothetical protein
MNALRFIADNVREGRRKIGDNTDANLAEVNGKLLSRYSVRICLLLDYVDRKMMD